MMNIFVVKTGRADPLKAAFNLTLLSVVFVTLFWFSLSKIGVTFDFSFLPPLKIRLVFGYAMTVCLSLASLVLSLLLGIISAAAQSCEILVVSYLSKLFVTFVRGTPLIMQIYIFYYIIGTAVGLTDRFVCGVLILSIFEGAYISEIIRGSLLSIDPTQIEAAKAVGFTKGQRISLIILPQLTARTLPALTGQFASIIKDSSLLSVIALTELTQTIREISALNFKFFESYLFLGILYLSLTLPLSFISKRLEARYSYEN